MAVAIRRLVSPTSANSIASISRSQLRIRSRTPFSRRTPFVCRQCRSFGHSSRRLEDGKKEKLSKDEDVKKAEKSEVPEVKEVPETPAETAPVTAAEDAAEALSQEQPSATDAPSPTPPEVTETPSQTPTPPQDKTAQVLEDIKSVLSAHGATGKGVEQHKAELEKMNSEELAQAALEWRMMRQQLDAMSPQEKTGFVKEMGADVPEVVQEQVSDEVVEQIKDAEEPVTSEELIREATESAQDEAANDAVVETPEIADEYYEEEDVAQSEETAAIEDAEDAATEIPPEAVKVSEEEVDEPEEALKTSSKGPQDLGFEDGDLPAIIMSHGESEIHKDLREYARLAAWELPLLHKLKKDFTPPDQTETPLRFRYTSYMGEHHPASRKVVVEFSPSHLTQLNPAQRLKLIKLAGPRFDPQSNLIKLSSEAHETPAQNKRYLGDLVARLITEAKDGKDKLEDIPVDVRHAAKKLEKSKKKGLRFPEEWKIQWEEGQQVKSRGYKERKVVERLAKSGKLVDGVKVIEEANKARTLMLEQAARKAGPGMLSAGPAKGKGKTGGQKSAF